MRADGRPCPSVLFRPTFACKNIFTNSFKTYWGIFDNFCEADVSNQDPRWTRKNRGRMHTGELRRKCLYAGIDPFCARAHSYAVARKSLRPCARICTCAKSVCARAHPYGHVQKVIMPADGFRWMKTHQ